ncbi:hypothetical protein AX15_005338 [Amanita polypyramis BW_CC]|nr:hypothetical protein AX15_005338 [Amanita polypyramis BW_CC]
MLPQPCHFFAPSPKLDLEIRTPPHSFWNSRTATMTATPGFVVVPEKEDPLSLLPSSSSSSGSSSVSTENGTADEAQPQPQPQPQPHEDGRPPPSSLLLGGSQCNDSDSNDNDNSNSSSSSTTMTSTATSSTPLPRPPTNSNSTLAFFDKFVNEAKVASESKRRSLLDELLLHQDDPLFHWARVARRGGDAGEEEEGKDGATVGEGDRGHGGDGDGRDMDTRGQVEDALKMLLVDATMRTAGPSNNSPPPPPSPHQICARRSSTATEATLTLSSSSPSSSVKHSPTLTPPTLAPPLLTEVVDMGDSIETDSDRGKDEWGWTSGFVRGLNGHRRSYSQTPTQSVPYARGEAQASTPTSSSSTLSGIPTRWMSSLLSSASSPSLPSGTGGAASSLESIFVAATSSGSRVRRRTIESLESSPVASAFSTTTSDTSSKANRGGGGSSSGGDGDSSSGPATHMGTDISIVQTSEKGQVQTQIPHGHASITTHQSPFAPHVFTPISGAPGFMERRYDWDKGFSTRLIKEMEGAERVIVREVESEGEEGKNANGSGSETAGVGVGVGGKTNGSGVGVGKGKRESVVKRIKGKLEKVGVRERRVNLGPTGNEVAIATAIGKGKENEGIKIEARGGVGVGVGVGVAGVGVGVGEFMEKKSGSVELWGRKEATVPVLDVALADMLRSHLPALDRLPRTWHLVYSLDQHGISLNTLYTRCEAHTRAQVKHASSSSSCSSSSSSSSPSSFISNTHATVMGIGRPGMLFVSKDSGDAVFGVWIGEGIRPSRGKGYYGSGESFMWRYVKGQLSVYRWTGRNVYVALCGPDYISFGGGDGRYGLYLDEGLFEGTSAACPTFDNDPLCSPGMNKAGADAFECVGLEVWGVGP